MIIKLTVNPHLFAITTHFHQERNANEMCALRKFHRSTFSRQLHIFLSIERYRFLTRHHLCVYLPDDLIDEVIPSTTLAA